jgi:hypothetical protein
MKVILEVEKGKNQGARYEVGVRSYRAIVRAGAAGEHTTDLSAPGEHALDPDDLARVEQHLARRVAGEPHAERLRLGAFARAGSIALDDAKVSKNHAMVFVDDDGPSVVDMLSTNGTHVNGKRVAEADLSDGDVINIGKTRFIVHVSA